MDDRETGQSQGNVEKVIYNECTEEEDNFYYNLNLCSLTDVADKEYHHTIDRSFNTKDKITHVVEEIIDTERNYIAVLKNVVENYIPHIEKHTQQGLIGKTSYLFGNFVQIYANAQEFLRSLENSQKDPDSIAQIFINSASEFELYPLYTKNKLTADIYLKRFEDVVKERQRQLNDDLDLASQLLIPIDRLGKYVLLLEKIKRELYKMTSPSKDIDKAMEIIRRIANRGNDYTAIYCIRNSEIDLTVCGSFLKRSYFNILKPKKFESMVFLFDQVIVFTKGVDDFEYVDSVDMTDLVLEQGEEKSTIFTLVKFTKSKTASSDATYVLEAKNLELKDDWISIINKKLWGQFTAAAEAQQERRRQKNQ